MTDTLLSALIVFNQILDAGNSITAFSLLLYTLTFNLRERVAQAFALLMACITLVFFGDVLVGTGAGPAEQDLWLRMQWLGIAFVPSAYLHLSDALLAATGRPSRGRRRMVVRLSYLASGAVLAAAGLTRLLVGEAVIADGTAFLAAGPLFPVFVLFLAGALSITALNLWRAHQRCLTRASRRRMRYLIAGALAPALGVFPFLTLSGGTPLRLAWPFWGTVAGVNLAVAGSLVLMAYVVAYYGVSTPDRVVKGRLFQWILRGPVVASSVLAITVIVNRLGIRMGFPNSRLVPFAMVALLLLLQYVITLIRPPIERWLFYGQDRDDVSRLQLLEARLLTTGDLRQFLEAVLNALCDLTGAPAGFVAALEGPRLELEVSVGPEEALRLLESGSPQLPPGGAEQVPGLGPVFTWEGYGLMALRNPEGGGLIGLLGLRLKDGPPTLEPGEAAHVGLLVEKAAVALTDRLLQKEVFGAVDRLVPAVEAIQRLTAAARHGGTAALTDDLAAPPREADLANLVRDALGHYWGGPRLTRSPLLRLQVVREAIQEHDGNAANALRATLRAAIERTRPEGERRFTAEWVLYNILEMKFLEGRKVRDVALRLAVSEADLYRKQRVAIEAVARAIAEMERERARPARRAARPRSPRAAE